MRKNSKLLLDVAKFEKEDKNALVNTGEWDKDRNVFHAFSE